ncbi:hypothetical protein [Motiliproteus coralliicola]|uniref:hypothetical protein n=1 Tax=Motiliproteus coralliicola TaxID=2283196 RepID=UPI0014033B83|nr:hypothetical protein [Motiliproteus coralliicola]
MPWTYYLGITLLLWVLWDLFSGSVWLHREYRRTHEPFGYWLTMLLWTLVAVSCFYW